MAKEKVEIEISKEFGDVCDAVAAMAVSVIAGMKDGKFDPAVDGVALLGAFMAKVGPAVDGIGQIPDEVKEDLAVFISTADIKLVSPILGAVLKKA